MRAVVALLLVLALVRPAAAAPIDALLDEADRAYANLDYRNAATAAEHAARDDAATKLQRLRAWSRAGLSWLVLGQRQLAKEALGRLFTMDPAYVVEDPSLSSKQHQFIDDERARHPAEKAPEPVVVPVITAPVVTAMAPVKKTPVYRRWYVWVPVAAVVAVGLGVGLGLGLTGNEPHGTLPPGTVGLVLHL